MRRKSGKINHLENTMLGNSTAIQRPRDQASTNGAQRSAGKKISAQTMEYNSSHPHNVSNLELDHITLWRHPIITLHYFFSEVFIHMLSLVKKTLLYKRTVCAIISITILFLLLGKISGPQQEIFRLWEAKIIWWLYWVGLGVLSSVGLGTGLHTFVLYLGPHIAAVTIAAYECGGLNFPEPPYPDEIICPTKINPMWTVGILNIMKKVRVEAMLWGAGTALGELPPYFVARAARLNGKNSNENFDQEDLKELEELEGLEVLESGENVSFVTHIKLHIKLIKLRIKSSMKRFVEKAGFWGILACASIPNPLFDLAGLTCGHYLIPFWTFFGATLVGKAVIKMHIQQLAVIIAFNEELLDKFISLLAVVPFVGTKFQEPLKKYFIAQKQKLHDKSSMEGATTISWLFDKFVTLMVCYFLVSIVHSLAQNHHRRRTKPAID
ncbi:vacuole membrane protein 1 isoform X1 [Solenopsis invicta]|uniref:vacuole membrane protein 1 isoform X1 n=2 Tax=Solenopsis invicta TaxID=13686 RepID=UPI00059609A6|nr:vacuole membrane protein 1 isoform X1 [Solenopsis invicta]